MWIVLINIESLPLLNYMNYVLQYSVILPLLNYVDQSSFYLVLNCKQSNFVALHSPAPIHSFHRGHELFVAAYG